VFAFLLWASISIGQCFCAAQTSTPPPVFAPPPVASPAAESSATPTTIYDPTAVPAVGAPAPTAAPDLPAVDPIETASAATASLIPSVVPDEDSVEVEPASFDVGPGPTYEWYHFAYWFGPTPWDIGFELGINGTQGTNEALSFRTGGHLKRETKFWKFNNTLVYNKNTANSIETQNNALLDIRVDRKIAESAWSLYFLNQELYDEFQAYDLRASANAGVGYQWIDLDHLKLKGRFGAGASREFGGPDDETKYEALFGFEYDHEISKTQRLAAKMDYFPEWGDFSLYRVVTDIGWEIDLDRPGNTSLKFSVVDRYDSTPNGANPNEVNYSVLLIWGI